MSLGALFLLSACSVDAATQAEADARLLSRLEQAEAAAARSSGAQRLLAQAQRLRLRAQMHRSNADDILRRPPRGWVGRIGGGRGNFQAAQAEKRMAQTREAEARTADKKRREHIVQHSRKALGVADYERAVGLRKSKLKAKAERSAKASSKRGVRGSTLPTSRPGAR